MENIYTENREEQNFSKYFLAKFKKPYSNKSFSLENLQNPEKFINLVKKKLLNKFNLIAESERLNKAYGNYTEYSIFEFNKTIVEFDMDHERIEVIYDITSESCLDFVKKIEMIYDKQKTQQEPNVELDPSISLVVKSTYGLTTRPFDIKKVNIDIKENYNDGFHKFNRKMIKFLLEKDTGLTLLHGAMGTGKTNYIRHLINLTKENRINFIYFPPNMVEVLADPGFINFISENQNSVILLEDAEKILKKRSMNENTNATSNLLNVTDGLLGDCLKVRVIATFNCQRNEIDEALLRKGRLFAEYEFKKLKPEKAMSLAKKIGIKNFKKGEYSLAEMYNWK